MNCACVPTGPCPNCGYCPCCGRPRTPVYGPVLPWWQQPTQPPPQPIWEYQPYQFSQYVPPIYTVTCRT